jgi:hypothetical protein
VAHRHPENFDRIDGKNDIDFANAQRALSLPFRRGDFGPTMPLTRADRALYCEFAGDRSRLSSVSDGIRTNQPVAGGTLRVRLGSFLAAGAHHLAKAGIGSHTFALFSETYSNFPTIERN